MPRAPTLHLATTSMDQGLAPALPRCQASCTHACATLGRHPWSFHVHDIECCVIKSRLQLWNVANGPSCTPVLSPAAAGLPLGTPQSPGMVSPGMIPASAAFYGSQGTPIVEASSPRSNHFRVRRQLIKMELDTIMPPPSPPKLERWFRHPTIRNNRHRWTTVVSTGSGRRRGVC
ncbi:hypothetical protein MHU86_16079 [Fragilaria crotonensis]|nr:hypothetical protein MHU86_16079 [Fragilaria crotonensis]